jgi:pyruvate dehydrogenase E1 component alpha subunit
MPDVILIINMSAASKLTYHELLNVYERMFLIRRIEENIFQLYRDKYIGGYCHVYIGQEAVLMGVKQYMTDDDTMMTAYRSHGHLLESGATPEQLVSELLGKVHGSSQGKGGSMHLFWPQGGFYGGHGSVGSYISFGTGLGLAHKRLGKGITYTFFGDGAFNQGQAYESMNMASLWNLPVVYIIENNGYAIGTSLEMACAGGELRHRAEPFGIQTVEADGMDLFDMMEKVEWATNIARAGRPVLIEAKTYRFKGHSISDPATYRAKEEVEAAKLRDPIDKVVHVIAKDALYADGIIDEIKAKVNKRVKEAVEFAKNDKEPEAPAIFQDVYSWNVSKQSMSLYDLRYGKACK